LQIGLVKPSLGALRATAFGKLPNAAGWQPALPKTFAIRVSSVDSRRSFDKVFLK